MRIIWAILLSAGLLVGSAMGADETSETMNQIAELAGGGLAIVEGTVEDELGPRSTRGLAICISTDPPVFMSGALDVQTPAESFTSVTLTRPGIGGETIAAELMGPNRAAGLMFIRPTEPAEWTALPMAASADLQPGKQVFSAGILPTEPDAPIYLGMAYVSSLLRSPQTIAYVTGGWLTAAGSPVFDDRARMIGIVAGERPIRYQTMSQRGQMAPTVLVGDQQAGFFTPIDEFAFALENIPAAPEQAARLPWLGILSFTGVADDMAEIMGLDQPGVMVDQVLPGQPAARAGLENRDVIIAFNGQPVERMATPDMTSQQLQRRIAQMTPGDTITLTVLREDQTRDVRLTLGEMPLTPGEAPKYLSRELGFLVREKVLVDQYLDKSSAARVEGLPVVVVARETPAANAGLQQGDLIVSVGGQRVSSAEVFSQMIDSALSSDPPRPISMTVRRGDTDQVITIEPPVR